MGCNCANVQQIIFFFAVFVGEAYRLVQGSTDVSWNPELLVLSFYTQTHRFHSIHLI